MSLVIRRITIAVLAAALVGAVLAVPASSKTGPQAVASKKAKNCKKKKGKKKKKGCKRSTQASGLPGQATPAKPTAPNSPPTAPTLHVSNVSVAPNRVYAGNPTTGHVTLDAAAPSGGQVVDLQSNAASVSVPGGVVVAAGQNSANFAVTTTPATPATATLTASIGASSATAQLTVVNDVSVSSVKLQRQCFTVGTFSANRVTLDVPAPVDTSVSLSSDHPSVLQVPPSVTVPAGSSSAFFSLDAFAPPTDPTTVMVTASLNSTQASDSAPVSATDPATHAVGLTLNPDTVIANNGTTGTVTLDCEAPPGGTTVSLSSADPGVTFASTGNQTATVNVLQGQLSADFDINTDGTLADGQYDISATVGADTPVHATLTIDSSLPT